MKTLKSYIRIVLISAFLFQTINSAAQETINIDKIDAIINLSRFIDWHSGYNNTDSKKLLFILSDKNSSINYEIQSKNNFKYKNWQIICSNRYDQIVNGSIVFILNEEKSKASELIKVSKVKNILTVADNIDSFCEDGGMINIKNQDGRYRFEINYQEIQNKDIEINSKLLALAKIL
ncbi:MAG: YfiR family protein [Bacteroidota bacterium]